MYSRNMETERRSERRFRLSRMVAYDMGQERYIRAQGCDISREGMAFNSDEFVENNLPVWLSFSIPEADGAWRDIEAEGLVASVNDLAQGCRFGVTFSRMTAEDEEALSLFFERLEHGEVDA